MKQEDKLAHMIARAEGMVKIDPVIMCEDIDWMFPSAKPGDQFYPYGPHDGQLEGWGVTERIILMLAGTQGGKTVEGARLLLREIQRTAVPGELNDYLIVGPDLVLLKKKAIPEFLRLTCNKESPDSDLAEYNKSEKILTFTPEGSRKLTGQVCEIKVFMGHAHDPSTLESATYKGIWADECGQADFKKESWEALQRRAAVYTARIFLTTTPYSIRGWLKDLCDRAHELPDTVLVTFSSIANPLFPVEEYEKMKREMPDWRFEMFCNAKWSKPAGAIYNCFDDTVGPRDGETNVCDPFTIPVGWIRHVGMDFGEVNMASVFIAEDEDGTLYVYGEYRAGSLTIKEHTKLITDKGLKTYRNEKDKALSFEHTIGGTWTGDDPEFRREFIDAGFPVHRPPIKGVEPGITRVYRQFKTRKLKVFSSCKKLLAEINDYSRKVNEHGEALVEIEDKSIYHLLDSLRYIISFLRQSGDIEIGEIQRVEMSDVEPVGSLEKSKSLRRIV